MEQAYAFTHVFWNVLIQIVHIRAVCDILSIRHKAIYACISMTLLVAGAVIQSWFPALEPVRIFVVGPLNSFFVPIALSQKPIAKRLTRILAVSVAMAVPEFLSMATYLWLEGKVFSVEVTEANFGSMTLAYMAGFAGMVVALEVLITLCKLIDQREDYAVELPVIGLLLITYIMFGGVAYSFYAGSLIRRMSPLAALACLACVLATLILAFLALNTAQHEIATGRSLADSIAFARQAKHLKMQIEASTQRVIDLRYLRHDLANQIGIISQLLEEGHTVEADEHLAKLQQRVQRLEEDAHA